jgi:exo-1,4-beta-D-glucosaminidase
MSASTTRDYAATLPGLGSRVSGPRRLRRRPLRSWAWAQRPWSLRPWSWSLRPWSLRSWSLRPTSPVRAPVLRSRPLHGARPFLYWIAGVASALFLLGSARPAHAADTKAADAKAADTKAAGAKPADTKAAGTKPAGTKPAGAKPDLAPGGRLYLRDGWAVRSSAQVPQSGAALSSVGYPVSDWTPAHVPVTVVAARLANHEIPDPYFGMNLRQLAGTSDYPVGGRFALHDMTSANPYKAPWWYRTEVDLPATRERVWLHFDGINYRANIWLNGKRVAVDKDVAGSYRRYAFDVTALAKPGQRNALAVEVYSPGKNDLAPSFVDWNPTPPDRNLGLWQEVYLATSGPVRLEHAFVTSKVPSRSQARLTIGAELTNTTGAKLTATVNAVIGAIRVSETVTLGPHEKKAISLTPEAHPELVVSSPRLWWPYQLGPQNLHDLQLSVSIDGNVSDRSVTRFGMREVTMELVDGLWASYKVNGTPLFIRGGGYTSDMLLRFSAERDEQEMQLVKDLGLNTIRIEGKLANDHLFDVTDREGILVIAGWECCSAWEYWVDDQQTHGIAPWNEATRAIAAASLRSQLYRLRGRASMLSFLYGSDSHPPPDIERMYLGVVKETRWPLPTHNQASEREPSTVTGPSGFKMTGPYDYVPPAYWYIDQKYGGAFGFNSETGPGAAVPNVESLKKFLPADKLWPINATWHYHMGSDRFATLDTHTQALEGRYGKATSVEDYALKAQALAYDGQRAMFEAYRRNKGKTTGVVAWMLNSAWPSLLWHLYDYYLALGGGYYGTKKANELVHIQYSYDDRTVVVVNDSAAPVDGLKAQAEIWDLHGKKRHVQERAKLHAGTDKSVVALTLPAPEGEASFVRLTLRNAKDQVVSQNFYWLASKPDVLEWSKTDWWGTPVTSHGDLTSLKTLEPVTPKVSARSDGAGGLRVTVHNGGKGVAFLVRLRVTRGAGGDEILPSTWSDNYVSLVPGESRELSVHLPAGAAAGRGAPVVVVSGWNVPSTTVAAIDSARGKRGSSMNGLERRSQARIADANTPKSAGSLDL